MGEMEPLLVTAAEACRVLSLSDHQVRDLVKKGTLVRAFIGKGTRNYRITYDSLVAYKDGLSQDPVSV